LELIQIRPNHSRIVLLRIGIISVITGMVLYWQSNFIFTLYFGDQTTQTGVIINGAIIAMFIIGFLQIILLLLRYIKEEASTRQFLKNLQLNPKQPLEDIDPNAMISFRYKIIKSLNEQKTPIQHGALASALLASVSARNSLLKFINNILILMGVFGTIVSLSIALVGASDLLTNVINADGMGVVIHGMSTALSTTMTAIICFVFFSFLYTHLMDVQTNTINAIEQVTTTYILPRYQVQADNILFEVSGLIRSLQTLTNEIATSHQQMANISTKMAYAVETYLSQVDHLSGDISEIKALLHEGFRLPEKP
jgi:hypothetical protein